MITDIKLMLSNLIFGIQNLKKKNLKKNSLANKNSIPVFMGTPSG
jgi:hypothetical protein